MSSRTIGTSARNNNTTTATISTGKWRQVPIPTDLPSIISYPNHFNTGLVVALSLLCFTLLIIVMLCSKSIIIAKMKKYRRKQNQNEISQVIQEEAMRPMSPTSPVNNPEYNNETNETSPDETSPNDTKNQKNNIINMDPYQQA